MAIKPIILIRNILGGSIGNIITKFSYKFSEKDDEVCEFTIESDNPYLADDPDLQEGSALVVQWGYTDGRLSKPRRVWIFDIDSDYSDSGIVLKFTCHEKFVLAKMDTASSKSLDKLTKDTPIIFSSEVLANVSLEIEKGNPNLKSLLDKNNINIDNAVINPADPDKVVSFFNGNYTSFKSLKDFFNKFPGGPYVIDSRDEGVIIRTRDFKKPAHLTYSYNKTEGNPILSFKPETKNRSNSSKSSAVNVTSWDPAKKEATIQEANQTDKGQTKLADKPSFLHQHLYELGEITHQSEIVRARNTAAAKGTVSTVDLGNVEISQEQKSVLDAQVKAGKIKVVNFGGVKVDTGFRKQQKINAPPKPIGELEKKIRAANNGKIPKAGDNLTGEARLIKVISKYDYGTRARNTTNQKGFKPYTGKLQSVATDNTAVAKRYEIDEEDKPAGKNLLSLDDKKKAGALASNTRKDAELDTNPATLKIEGEPSLESGMIVTIVGVALKHAGNYYIRDIEHTIDENGYLTNASKMGRQGVNKSNKAVSPDTNLLPTSKYLYELTKSESLKWEDGNLINVSKGEVDTPNKPQTVNVPSDKPENT